MIDPGVDSVLANFDMPGKIDLVSFMQRNFMFNMPLEKLGYLTGRSLSTFNRDFKKLFHTTPQKWLTDKRLELAHYQLTEKGKSRPRSIWKPALRTCPIFRFLLKRNTVSRPGN